MSRKPVYSTTNLTPSDVDASRRRVPPADAAGYIGCERSYVYSLIHRGILTAYRLPGTRRLFVDLDQVDALMQPVAAAEASAVRAPKAR